MHNLKTLIKLLLVGVILLIPGCASNTVKDYSDTTPAMDFQKYFNGPIKAWGIVQDRDGKVLSRFDVAMQGSWKDNLGTLKEDFTYYSGKKQERVWKIHKLPDGTYEGEADDIIGKAEGQTSGSAVRWNYVMDVPVDDTTYRFTFDDWMWLMNDGVLINRSYLRKFGFTFAELTIVMKKQ